MLTNVDFGLRLDLILLMGLLDFMDDEGPPWVVALVVHAILLRVAVDEGVLGGLRGLFINLIIWTPIVAAAFIPVAHVELAHRDFEGRLFVGVALSASRGRLEHDDGVRLLVKLGGAANAIKYLRLGGLVVALLVGEVPAHVLKPLEKLRLDSAVLERLEGHIIMVCIMLVVLGRAGDRLKLVR